MIMTILSFIMLMQMTTLFSIVPLFVFYLIARIAFHRTMKDWITFLNPFTTKQLCIVLLILEIIGLAMVLPFANWWFLLWALPYRKIVLILLCMVEIIPFILKYKKVVQYFTTGSFEEKENVENPIYK